VTLGLIIALNSGPRRRRARAHPASVTRSRNPWRPGTMAGTERWAAGVVGIWIAIVVALRVSGTPAAL
jgi:hypothetical protein